ncbi:MAG: hypothetical protein ABIL16_01830 [candidate division WOR-3 bacterium]
MIFILSITEDSILRVFDRIFESKTFWVYSDLKAIYDIPKGYLFPKLYLFYDEFNISPLPTIRVQYADTVNLRLTEREIEIGYPFWRRWGFGFYWNPLNPQVIFAIKSSRYMREWEYSKIEGLKENVKNNLRVYLRILINLDSVISVLDSLISLGEELLVKLDTLGGLKRLEGYKLERIKGEVEGLKDLREYFIKTQKSLKDSLESLLDITLEGLELNQNFKPQCAKSSDSLKIKALNYKAFAESLWWFPKLYLFGEVWNGNITTPSTVVGFRVVFEFDETKRLYSKAAHSLKRLETIKGNLQNLEPNFKISRPERDILHYKNLINAAKRFYEGGGISFAEYFEIYSDYSKVKIEAFENRIKGLLEGLCDYGYDYQEQYYEGGR